MSKRRIVEDETPKLWKFNDGADFGGFLKSKFRDTFYQEENIRLYLREENNWRLGNGENCVVVYCYGREKQQKKGIRKDAWKGNLPGERVCKKGILRWLVAGLATSLLKYLGTS